MPSGLIEIMKRAALDATDNAQMCDLRYGTVVSINPLKVQVTNQFTIPSALLVVPKHLTDHAVTVSFDWETDKVFDHTHDYRGDTQETDGHTHSYSSSVDGAGAHSHTLVSKANRTMTIHNALKIGDKVALLRKQGGQSYFILDRI